MSSRAAQRAHSVRRRNNARRQRQDQGLARTLERWNREWRELRDDVASLSNQLPEIEARGIHDSILAQPVMTYDMETAIDPGAGAWGNSNWQYVTMTTTAPSSGTVIWSNIDNEWRPISERLPDPNYDPAADWEEEYQP